MFDWFARCARQKHYTIARRTRPQLERLEARDCPAPLRSGPGGGGSIGPVISNVAAVALPNNTIQVSGQVSDPDPATVTVGFSGVASGGATTDINGNFSVIFNASTLGNETVTALDSQNLSATPVTVAVTDSPPQISSFQAVNSTGTWWTFSGIVTNTAMPQNVTVTLTGLSGLTNVSVAVNSDGTFSFTVQLAPSVSGVVLATPTDCWNQSGSTQCAYVD